jgi:HPt (histidine-containing phosphotransfer) domain-containing protein
VSDCLLSRIAALRVVYIESLPERLLPVRELMSAPDAGAAARQEAIRAAHSIAGSAATFGLPELGDAARTLEDALREDVPLDHAAPLAALVALDRSLEPLGLPPVYRRPRPD